MGIVDLGDWKTIICLNFLCLLRGCAMNYEMFIEARNVHGFLCLGIIMIHVVQRVLYLQRIDQVGREILICVMTKCFSWNCLNLLWLLHGSGMIV